MKVEEGDISVTAGNFGLVDPYVVLRYGLIVLVDAGFVVWGFSGRCRCRCRWTGPVMAGMEAGSQNEPAPRGEGAYMKGWEPPPTPAWHPLDPPTCANVEQWCMGWSDDIWLRHVSHIRTIWTQCCDPSRNALFCFDSGNGIFAPHLCSFKMLRLLTKSPRFEPTPHTLGSC